MRSPALPAPASYFPLEKGLYEVAPGLRPIAADLGNGRADSLAFQLDRDFADYRANKLRCRAERLGKYSVRSDPSPEVERAACEFVVERLAAEHPAHFTRASVPGGGTRLDCAVTGEWIEIDADGRLRSATPPPIGPAYESAFDALCSQVQEDVAVMSGDRLVLLHLCSPGHWSAEDKIGKSFFEIHAPVADIDKINRAAASFVHAMVHKGPYQRFVWGFGTDRHLNHHPVPPVGATPEQARAWKGRSFDASAGESPFILRMERQVTWGLPAVNASMFMIRPSFIDGAEIRRDPARRALLCSALRSMTPASLIYKGLESSVAAILEWLESEP